MKILLVNKFLYLKGGNEKYCMECKYRQRISRRER